MTSKHISDVVQVVIQIMYNRTSFLISLGSAEADIDAERWRCRKRCPRDES